MSIPVGGSQHQERAASPRQRPAGDMPLTRGMSITGLSSRNERVILDAVRRSGGGVSRIALAEMTGLSQQAISKLVRRLISDGLLVESGTRAVGRGKPPTLLMLEPRSRFAIGIHIDPASFEFVVLDITGAPVAHRRQLMASAPGPEEAAELITAGIEELIAQHNLPRDRVLGVGIAVPGPIDDESGTIVAPGYLRGWESVPLRATVSDATGLAVLVDKDVSAAAEAELWSGMHAAHRSFAVLYLGTGIGLGLVMGNKVMRGDFHNLGEIGHLYTGQETATHVCGRAGCLATLIEPQFLVPRAIRLGALEGHPDDEIDFRRLGELFDALGQMARGGEPRTSKLIEEASEGLGRVIVDIANLLDLDRVVLTGPAWPAISDSLLRTMNARVGGELVATQIHKVEVVASSTTHAAAIGGACLFLEHVFSAVT